MHSNFTPNVGAVSSRPANKRRKQRAGARRNTSGTDVLAAIALPVTLPIRTCWWLLCHPYETTLLACIGIGGWMLSGVIA